MAVAHVKRGTGLIKLNGKPQCRGKLVIQSCWGWNSIPRKTDLGTELVGQHSLSVLSRAGSPLDLVQPDTLRFKVQEPIALLGEQRFQTVDIRVRVKGGGHVSQAYGELSGWISTQKAVCWQSGLTAVICGTLN